MVERTRLNVTLYCTYINCLVLITTQNKFSFLNKIIVIEKVNVTVRSQVVPHIHLEAAECFTNSESLYGKVTLSDGGWQCTVYKKNQYKPYQSTETISFMVQHSLAPRIADGNFKIASIASSILPNR